MAFTVQDYDDLLRLLDERPQWREALRRRVLGDELLELPALVRQLVEAQAGTDARAGRLEAAVERLVAAQARTDARVADLAAAVERLVEAQRATRRELGGLADLIGATMEEDAEETTRAAAIAHGWTPRGGPVPLQLNGDVDLAMQVEDGGGERFWVLTEAKLRLRRGEVREWVQQLHDPGFRRRIAEDRVPGPYVAYAFGLRVSPAAVDVARDAGVGVLRPVGEVLAPVTRWT